MSEPVHSPEYFIGLMSGTSMDGIDAVLADFTADRCRVHGQHHQPYHPETLADLKRMVLSPREAGLADVAALDARIAVDFSRAASTLLQGCDIHPSRVTAIGSHGQTVLHSPLSNPAFTVQLGDPAIIAARTGIPVIGHFRQGDLAEGGQGAPLVPAFHAFAFGQPPGRRAILNIGGIANLTLLSPIGAEKGFDTGPGNTLLDGWCQDRRGEPFDRDGAWAASGRVVDRLLAAMLQEPYFDRMPPKSTGIDVFNRGWLGRYLGIHAAEADPADIQATLAELTAATIAEALRRLGPVAELIACGGGTYNRDLLARLGRRLPGCQIATSDDWGIPPNLVEAAAFAWMARERLASRPSNVPCATGARCGVSLGGIYLPGTPQG